MALPVFFSGLVPWLFLDQGELALLRNMPDGALTKRTQAGLGAAGGKGKRRAEGAGGMTPPGLPAALLHEQRVNGSVIYSSGYYHPRKGP